MQKSDKLKIKVLSGLLPFWNGCEIIEIDFTSMNDENMISIILEGNSNEVMIAANEIKFIEP